jgi:S1-C subfamily serine protease
VPEPRLAALRAAGGAPGFPACVAAGILVTRVTPGGPAHAAGLREDDMIVGVGGECGGGGGSSSSTSSSSSSSSSGVAGGSTAPQQQLRLSVSQLADALSRGIGGTVVLTVVREVAGRQQQQAVQGGRGAAADSSSSNRYQFVTLAVRPVVAPKGVAAAGH